MIAGPARRTGEPVPEPAAWKALPLWAHVLDALTIAALTLWGYLLVHGGFILHFAGSRALVKSAWRPFAWAAVLALVRHALVLRPPICQSVGGLLAAAGRAPGPLPGDDGQIEGRDSTATSPRTPPLRTALVLVGVVALYAALTVAMTYPQIREMRSVSVDTGDPLLSTWRLSWFAHQLPRDPLHLFDANIFYPEARTLAYSDSMLVPSMMIAPIVWLGVDRVVAYNILLLSGFALSGAAMFLLVRSLTRHLGAALVAGFVFAFLPYRFMHYAHLELQMAQWIPLSLWAFHRTVRDGRLRDGLLTGLFFALQMLSSMYYGMFFALFLVPLALAELIAVGRLRAVRAFRPLAAGAALSAVLIAPCAVPYLQARRTVGERPASEVEFYSAQPQDYMAAHTRNALLGSLRTKWGGQERELFEGIAVPAIALIGLWPPLSAARIGYALAFLVAFESSLGVNGVLYPLLFKFVLPFRGLRVPARMGMLVGLALAVLAGYGTARIARRCRSRGMAAVAVTVLLLLVFVEYRSTLVLTRIWPERPQVYTSLPAGRTNVVLNFPLIAPDIAYEPVYMYFSTFDWHKVVNGYSGFSSPSYLRMLERLKTFPNDAGFQELRRHDVEFVVVHGAFYSPEAYRNLVSQMDLRKELRLTATCQWEGRETRMYEVVSQAEGHQARLSH
jgi:hypothetical protein